MSRAIKCSLALHAHDALAAGLMTSGSGHVRISSLFIFSFWHSIFYLLIQLLYFQMSDEGSGWTSQDGGYLRRWQLQEAGHVWGEGQCRHGLTHAAASGQDGL